MLDLVLALPHDHHVAEDPRQLALRLHLPEVIPITQAPERVTGQGEQLQVNASVETALFLVAAAGL